MSHPECIESVKNEPKLLIHVGFNIMKNKITKVKTEDLVQKAQNIAYYSLREMLEVERYTKLLEVVFSELIKQQDGSAEKKALSAIARSLATHIIITMHAACFDMTRSKCKKGKYPIASIAGIMRGKKISFCDAVSLLDGNSPRSKAAQNLATKQRVALGAKWKNWTPYIRFKEEDGSDTEAPFPVFDGELKFNERIQNQAEAQRTSITSWKNLRVEPYFKRVNNTRNNIYAHLNMKTLKDRDNIASFKDVIELSKKSLTAMRTICKVHFGIHQELEGPELAEAFKAMLNNQSKL